MTARPASEDGHRVRLHVRAETERGQIYSFLLRFGDGSHGGVVFHSKGARQLSLPLASHRYRRAGTYRIWVVAESESRRCGDKKSEPATLRVRVPLR